MASYRKKFQALFRPLDKDFKDLNPEFSPHGASFDDQLIIHTVLSSSEEKKQQLSGNGPCCYRRRRFDEPGLNVPWRCCLFS